MPEISGIIFLLILLIQQNYQNSNFHIKPRPVLRRIDSISSRFSITPHHFINQFYCIVISLPKKLN